MVAMMMMISPADELYSFLLFLVYTVSISNQCLSCRKSFCESKNARKSIGCEDAGVFP